ncbi:MAG TPA: hypothetical protein VNP73_06450 [Actinomycetota bacterium]|nr:hypothetical protein [Actinomycetota bacterium]
MGPDRKKQFLKKNSQLVPSDENVLAVIIAEGKGGAWRRGLAAGISSASPLAGAVADRVESVGAKDPKVGSATAWPEASIFWLAFTDKQLHVFEGQVNSQQAGPGAAHYPFDGISGMRFEKKLLISKLTVSFADGSSVELDIAKQNIKPFVEAIENKFASV